MKTLLTTAAGAAFMAATLLATPAFAIDVVTAAVTAPELKELATTYGADKVKLRNTELLNVQKTAEAAPTDLVFSTPALMDAMKADIAPGSVVKLGRANVVLAVLKGAPHPDISTVAKLAAVLKGAKNVVHSDLDPKRGSMVAILINNLLQRPEFAGVHHSISTKVNGAGGLVNGEGDMTLQFASEILPHPELEVVGPLPTELGAYADLVVGTMANAPDPAGAKAFVTFITGPEGQAVWKAHGLDPAH